MRGRLAAVAALVGVWVVVQAAAPAEAETFSFQCITNSDPANCGIAESQVLMEVIDLGTQVRFLFTNQGPDQATLARIYFDDGSLMSLALIDNGPGVTFNQTFPGPSELPGGDLATPPFMTSIGFLAGAETPPPSEGVEPDGFDQPGEYVALVFDLQVGQTTADVVSELMSGALRAGVHVINFASGGSESLVIVPEPASLAQLALGEYVALVFDLQMGQTTADVVSELRSGALRAGVHVINFASGGSESLVIVPEPASLAQLALGLVALAALRRNSTE